MLDEPIIAPSAYKHGLSREDILHAYRNPLRIWDLGDFCARPSAALRGLIEELGGDPEAAVNLPPMRKMAAMGRFLQRLRNAGLRPQLMGDFPAAETTNFRKDD